MTKKDYDLIANAIKTLPSVSLLKDSDKSDQHRAIGRHMAEALKGTNHAFDTDRFVAACTGEPYTKPAKKTRK